MHGQQNKPSALASVYEYHDQTKHQFQRYARSLGYMDWASQPDPFRRYPQAQTLPLDHPPLTDTPTYDSLFNPWQGPGEPVNRDSISRLFFESLAISAWKQAGNSRWSLRVNPSSGDLHPTEAYMIAGPVTGLSKTAAVYHYSAYQHALERLVTLMPEEWTAISQELPTAPLLIVLTSIYWRESWKYGERAYRYCHHDAGHAIGTVTFAAAALGWKSRLVQSVADEDLSILTGTGKQEGSEVEHADCLLLIHPAEVKSVVAGVKIHLPPALRKRLQTNNFAGPPNILSSQHHAWPIIDDVAAACRSDGILLLQHDQDHSGGLRNRNIFPEDRQVSARKIIRQRRSAVAMDGQSSINRETFYRMLAHVCPSPGENILEVLPWRSRVSLALFIHRVEELPTGLYLLIRDPAHEPSLRQALHPEFEWTRPAECPEPLQLYLLQPGDAREAARVISCHQEIAADGAFALGMLAEFDAGLEKYGPFFYPRLYWETGLIGQILYLEAEAAGMRATGIGCFFDDAMHELLGIRDYSWQSLYHFTVGGAVDDPRLQTLPSYWYLK